MTNQVLVQPLARSFMDQYPVTGSLDLRMGDFCLRIEVNHEPLLQRLRQYFRAFLSAEELPEHRLIALEAAEPDLGVEFLDWKRDPGKVGRKDSYHDTLDGRIVRKVRTGMQYLLGENLRLVIGPCWKNANQVINFVNSQYQAWLVQRGWLVCHAAAIAQGDAGIAIAAFSGGGKSTLALNTLRAGLTFVSNDRVMVRRDGNSVKMSGLPKFPRINPGTALHHPRLRSLLTEKRRQELAQMDSAELWDLEEKYDADVLELFDGVDFRLTAELHAFVILNWQRDGNQPFELRQVDLRERDDLLAAVMKPAGVFAVGDDPQAGARVDPAQYRNCFDSLAVYEAVGTVDFEAAARDCERLMGSNPAKAVR